MKGPDSSIVTFSLVSSVLFPPHLWYEVLPRGVVHLVDIALCLDLPQPANVLVEVNYGLSLTVEGDKTGLDGLEVVIDTGELHSKRV